MKYYKGEYSSCNNMGLYYDKFVYKQHEIVKEELINLAHENLEFDDKEKELAKKSERLSKKYKNNKEIIIKDISKYAEEKYISQKLKTEEEKNTLEYLKSAKNKDEILTKTLEYTRKKYKNNLKEDLKSGLKYQETMNYLNNVREKMILSYKKRNITTITGNYKTIVPLLIGIGIPSIDEIGFVWSRNYGLPYIPSSSIKGAFRNYIKNLENDFSEKEKLIFGSDSSESEAGNVYFFDAIPVRNIKLLKDIETPHFSDYYEKGNTPNDTENPKPIQFLSLEKNISFRFDFVIKDKKEEIKDFIEKHFPFFLENYGLGAKTSMGYGRFKKEVII
ncbi:MAG TPA: type III-B CRISPR module RAMP protein Cmr6 [Tepiditoga sp.]|nr:type III-B CRISPR module RAMP protein Cmr6 [Thermotogota bacterium]HOO75055.1 type III-B CRISPR module RAMP protein Cmr6 [Tepiditoga sp.]